MLRPTPPGRKAHDFIVRELEVGHWVAICEGAEADGFGAWIPASLFEIKPWLIRVGDLYDHPVIGRHAKETP